MSHARGKTFFRGCKKRLGSTFPFLLVILFFLTAVTACSGYTGYFGSGYRQLAAQDQKKADAIVRTARSQMGVRYKYGGASPKTGFDCSGLLYWAYRQHGVKIPRVAKDQASAGRKVDPARIAVGDLVVFKISSGYHTGIYAGEGKFIHSPKAGAKVRMEDMNIQYWRKAFVSARRLI